ncbi:MAG TPA: hypothetical protein VIL19_07075 [Casimicrobiaceae bacterium]
MVQGEFLSGRAKVNPYFCAFWLPENRWQSQTIFSGNDYEKTRNARGREGERNGELKTGNAIPAKAASASADTDSTSTGRKEG